MTATVASSLGRVRLLYNDLEADLRLAAGQPAADPSLSAEVAAALHHEARLLDARAFARWLDLWDDDAILWVPLGAPGDPGADQALFLDDRRRLAERVWRMGDPGAWALQPPGQTVRLVSGVEAWSLEDGTGTMAASAIAIQHVRGEQLFATLGRQVFRLRRGRQGWRIYRKTLLLPALSSGTPHLGWLL